jgi:hypothetical protein
MERSRLRTIVSATGMGAAALAAVFVLATIAALAGCENGLLTAIEKAVDSPPVWTLVAKRMAGTSMVDAHLGNSVSIDGEFIAAGAPNGDAYDGYSPLIADAGMSEEFWQMQGGADNWGKESGYEGNDPVPPNDPLAANDLYGQSVAVATIGTTGHALVGIPYSDLSYANSGKVFVKNRYSKSPGGGAYYWSWEPFTRLLASDRASGDYFGWAVAVDGSTGTGRAIVGAPNKSSMTGRVYIYEGSSSTWSQRANLSASDFDTGDNYGTSVAISGDYAIVGAPHNQVGVYSDVGAAYILFRDSGGTWSEQALLPGEDDESEQFGWSVAIDGTYAIVGAHHDGMAPTYQAGAAHVYRRSGVTWTHVAKLEASDRATSDMFGRSVAISGIYAVVGAPYSGTDDSGAVYVFRRWRDNWEQVAKLTATDGTAASRFFGTSVAIQGTSIVVGAPYDDQEAANAGAIYIFDAQ